MNKQIVVISMRWFSILVFILSVVPTSDWRVWFVGVAITILAYVVDHFATDTSKDKSDYPNFRKD